MAGRMFFSGGDGPEKRHEKISADRLSGGLAVRRSYVCLGSNSPTCWRIPTGTVAPQSLLWLLQLLLRPTLLRAVLLFSAPPFVFSAPLFSGKLSSRSSLPLLGLVLLDVVASQSSHWQFSNRTRSLRFVPISDRYFAYLIERKSGRLRAGGHCVEI